MIELNELIGWLGMIFIAIAFIPETIATIKKGKSELENSFVLPYLVGVLLIIYYSFQINSMPFVALNAILLLFLAIDIYFLLAPRKAAKPKRRGKRIR